MGKRWPAWVVVSTLAVLGPACTRTTAVAPYGLDAISLANTSEEISAVLAGLPDALRGLEANDPSLGRHTLRLSYGPDRDLAIVAQDWSETRDGPAWTAEELLPRLAGSGRIDVAASDLDGPLLWFEGENHVPDEGGAVLETFWTMWFGREGSGWVFAVNAPSAEDGVALVEAFVRASPRSD